MPRPMTIDVVSDITCPWCAVGISALEQAIDRTQDAADIMLRIHPFELNPDMPPEGRSIDAHLGERLGASPAQLAANRETLRAKAAEVGFTMAQTGESRIYNTFDAHRLLQGAGIMGGQAALKRALLEANFTHSRNLGDPDVLISAAEEAGLDPAGAREILSSGRYADEVRAEERLWIDRGINSVPAIIFNQRYLIPGAQSVEAFEQAIRQIAAEAG